MFGRPNPAKELSASRADLDQVEELIRSTGVGLDAASERVSRWTVGQQLAHVLLAGRAMFETVRRILSGPTGNEGVRGRANLLGRLVLTLAWIPRGRGEAPESVVPAGDPTEDALSELLHGARSDIDLLERELGRIRRSQATAHHFAFGHLTAPQWLRLARIHARHHLAIVRDILESAAQDRGAPPPPEETP